MKTAKIIKEVVYGTVVGGTAVWLTGKLGVEMSVANWSIVIAMLAYAALSFWAAGLYTRDLED